MPLNQKVEGSTEALLTILRKNFFNTLADEIRELGHLDVPVLIIRGREDKVVPLDSFEEFQRLIHGSRLEILEDAGHVLVEF